MLVTQHDILTKVWVWEGLKNFPELILHFTFRSRIHFELIFVQDVKYVSRFVFVFCMWRSI